MKTLNHRLMIAAVALTAAAGSALAQGLKADITFPFHAADATLASGTYTVTTNYSPGRSTYIIHSRETGAGVILAQYVHAGVGARTAMAKLTFECAGRDCVLRQLSMGPGEATVILPGARTPRGDDRRIAEVRLTNLKAD
jgi:hypothetical protein